MMDIKEKSAAFPRTPGVYLMKDPQGKVIYIGKAVDLKKRAAQYFARKAESRYQIKFLMSHVAGIECLVTETEKEALLLEDTLIKKHRPRYNIQLKDDKTYASLMLETTHPFPRLYVTRRVRKDGNRYFGPYASAFACRQTADFLQRRFRLRTCTNHEFANRSRPCLQYQIGRCEAPCVGLVTAEHYADLSRQVRLFLEGKNDELVAALRTSMQEASAAEHYEDAARARDLIRDIEATLEKQRVVTHGAGDRDWIALYREGESGVIAVMTVRDGRVSGTETVPFKSLQDSAELVESFLIQYYRAGREIPGEIFASLDLPSPLPLAEVLSELSGRQVLVRRPKRGDATQLMKVALRNAQESFRRRAGEVSAVAEVLAQLQQRLELGRLPRRMECFDISDISGKNPVGSMVSFADGAPDKSSYRKFKISLKQTPDDYGMMYEMLTRRFQIDADWKRELPDLLVVDGGKGQLAVARTVLKENNVLGVDAVGLAKPHGDEAVDKVYLAGRKDPVRLEANSSALFLLQRIRDEAHRFAITFHRARRARSLIPKKHPRQSKREPI